MNIKNLLLSLALLLPVAALAQSITPAQIEQFKSLPKAQQEALARQYGVDLSALEGMAKSESSRPEPVSVVEPTTDQAQERKKNKAEENQKEQALAEKNNGLKPFGYDLFSGSPTTFAPVTEIPVPTHYTLGPGDVLKVQLWGKENRNLELPISRDGTISFPEAGPVSVAGMSFDEARQQLSRRFSEQYLGVKASVSLGELRSIRVFVLGEARNPGSYTVSSLASMTNALYVSGGISSTGSLRNVQLKRDGKVVGSLDLYGLLLEGDSSADQRLQPGDVVFIPPVGKRAGIEGEVYRPALYELDGDDTLDRLVALAGGMTPQAYPQLIKIERTNEDFLRIIAEADLTQPSGKRAKVQAGDHITVASISEITGQYIEVQGAAVRTGRFAWVPGMRVSSVIKNLDADTRPYADKQYAAVVRTDPESFRISVLNIQLKDALANPGRGQDILLQEKDQLLLFTDTGKISEKANESAEVTEKAELAPIEFTRQKLFEPVLKRLKAQAGPFAPQQTITVTGPVRYPGEYPMPESGEVRDAIFVAGGLRDSASLLSAEVARRDVGDNGVEQTNILNIDLAQAMLGKAGVWLESRDRLLIKSIPAFGSTRTITLEGEVKFPGEYAFAEGETLSDVLVRAGGLTSNAFPRGAVFTRAKLKQLEAQRLREAEDRLKGDLLGVQLEGDKFGGQNSKKVEDVEGLLKDVQNSRAIGRMVVNLPAVLGDSGYQPILLQDGDSLTVPTIPQSVSVFGEVQFPTSHLHTEGLTVDDYLERSGGPTRQADENRVYVVKADGSVMLPEKSAWFGSRSQQLQPGDTIIVPIDVDRLNQLELWTNVSQIVYQMALGAAAVGNL